MIISPIIRGLFGLEWNAAANELSVTPSLPADWDHAKLSNIPMGKSHIDLEIKRGNEMLTVQTSGPAASQIHLKSRTPGSQLVNGVLQIPLPAIEAGFTQDLPEPGSVTEQMKVLDQQSTPNSLTLRLSAIGGSKQTLWLRINHPQPSLHATGASIPDVNTPLQKLQITFPPGTGYVEKQVSFNW
jgi:hypothetical protein